MTKQTNATVNPCSLNLEQMTSAYFYPDVLCGEISELAMPTVDELLFLGKNNISDIKWYMRREEKKLRNLLSDARHGLNGLKRKTPDKLQDERSSKDGVIYCNWRGMGYYMLPESLEKELKSAEAYSEAMRKRQKEIFTCKFGRDVAEWCSKTPARRSCDHRCFQHACTVTPLVSSVERDDTAVEVTSTASLSEADNSMQCSCYNACYGLMPFQHEACIFDHADIGLIHECVEYLEGVIADYTNRLKFVTKYLSNMTTAERQKYCPAMPPFNLDVRHNLFHCSRGDRVVMLMINRGGFVLKHGTANRMFDTLGRECWYLAADDEILSAPLRVASDESYRRSFCGIVLKEEDYNYLMDNVEFRKVWLRMASFFGTAFDANSMEQVLETSRS